MSYSPLKGDIILGAYNYLLYIINHRDFIYQSQLAKQMYYQAKEDLVNSAPPLPSGIEFSFDQLFSQVFAIYHEKFQYNYVPISAEQYDNISSYYQCTIIEELEDDPIEEPTLSIVNYVAIEEFWKKEKTQNYQNLQNGFIEENNTSNLTQLDSHLQLNNSEEKQVQNQKNQQINQFILTEEKEVQNQYNQQINQFSLLREEIEEQQNNQINLRSTTNEIKIDNLFQNLNQQLICPHYQNKDYQQPFSLSCNKEIKNSSFLPLKQNLFLVKKSKFKDKLQQSIRNYKVFYKLKLFKNRKKFNYITSLYQSQLLTTTNQPFQQEINSTKINQEREQPQLNIQYDLISQQEQSNKSKQYDLPQNLNQSQSFKIKRVHIEKKIINFDKSQESHHIPNQQKNYTRDKKIYSQNRKLSQLRNQRKKEQLSKDYIQNDSFIIKRQLKKTNCHFILSSYEQQQLNKMKRIHTQNKIINSNKSQKFQYAFNERKFKKRKKKLLIQKEVLNQQHNQILNKTSQFFTKQLEIKRKKSITSRSIQQQISSEKIQFTLALYLTQLQFQPHISFKKMDQQASMYLFNALQQKYFEDQPNQRNDIAIYLLQQIFTNNFIPDLTYPNHEYIINGDIRNERDINKQQVRVSDLSNCQTLFNINVNHPYEVAQQISNYEKITFLFPIQGNNCFKSSQENCLNHIISKLTLHKSIWTKESLLRWIENNQNLEKIMSQMFYYQLEIIKILNVDFFSYNGTIGIRGRPITIPLLPFTLKPKQLTFFELTERQEDQDKKIIFRITNYLSLMAGYDQQIHIDLQAHMSKEEVSPYKILVKMKNLTEQNIIINQIDIFIN